MRRLSLVGGTWFMASCMLANGLEAAVIKGRVVNTAGRPIAGAEIRLYRKVKAPGVPASNELMSFAGKETLRADEQGQFATPQIADAKTLVQIVALADGKLAGHSGWVPPAGDIVEVDDIVLVGLRAIVGQVTDSRGAPVAGATVFNCDGRRRVETKSGRTGKFVLEDVPESALFVFAKNDGFRLTGAIFAAGKPVELRMLRRDEPAEPPHSLAPSQPRAERAAIARRLLDPYLEAVRDERIPDDKRRALRELAAISPADALGWLDRFAFANPLWKQESRRTVLMVWMRTAPAEDWDDLRTAIESSEDNDLAADCLLEGAAHFIPFTDRDRIRDWLDRGQRRAKTVENPTSRVLFLALAAEALWRLGDRQHAATAANEAQAAAKEQVGELHGPDFFVLNRLPLALAPVDLPAALRWLDQVKNDRSFAGECGVLATALAPLDSAAAEEAWNHAAGRKTREPAFFVWRDENAPDFCFQLAQTDRPRAERIAAAVADPFWRARALGAIAYALDGPVAVELLDRVKGDRDLARYAFALPRPGSPYEGAALALAGLLPVAEKVDPPSARELLWQALSLRPLQPAIGALDDEMLVVDAKLAQMVARYDREMARALLRAPVQRLPAKALDVISAAAFVDPTWAAELLATLPEPPDVSWTLAKNSARLLLVHVLGLSESRLWKYAGFWEPPQP